MHYQSSFMYLVQKCAAPVLRIVIAIAFFLLIVLYFDKISWY